MSSMPRARLPSCTGFTQKRSANFRNVFVSFTEERKERDHLKQLREKYQLDNNSAWSIGREETEKAVSKLVGNSADRGAATH